MCCNLQITGHEFDQHRPCYAVCVFEKFVIQGIFCCLQHLSAFSLPCFQASNPNEYCANIQFVCHKHAMNAGIALPILLSLYFWQLFNSHFVLHMALLPLQPIILYRCGSYSLDLAVLFEFPIVGVLSCPSQYWFCALYQKLYIEQQRKTLLWQSMPCQFEHDLITFVNPAKRTAHPHPCLFVQIHVATSRGHFI